LGRRGVAGCARCKGNRMSDAIHMMMIYSNDSSPTFTHTHTHTHTQTHTLKHTLIIYLAWEIQREREREKREGETEIRKREVRFDAAPFLPCRRPAMRPPTGSKPSTLNPQP